MSLIKFKSKRSLDRAFLMHPLCVMILGAMAWWAAKRGLSFVVTETATNKAEDDAINRQHAVHRDFRGFDIRIGPDWTEKDLSDFEIYFESQFAQYAATSSSTGEKNLVVIHRGTARHIHIQIAVIYALAGINLKEKLYEIE